MNAEHPERRGQEQTQLAETVNGRTACDANRALVADDEAAVGRLFKRLIQRATPAVSVDTACDGLEAVRSFSEHHHALLILDVDMPVMDGATAYAEIARICKARNWTMPAVIFCTGYAPPALVERLADRASRHTLFLKPILGPEMIRAVRQMLN